jgi:hypothetical protein
VLYREGTRLRRRAQFELHPGDGAGATPQESAHWIWIGSVRAIKGGNMRMTPDKSVCPGGGEKPEQPLTAPASMVATVRRSAREAMCRL